MSGKQMAVGVQVFDLRLDFFLCPTHGLFVPSRFSGEWTTDEGCPVLMSDEECCGERLMPAFLDALDIVAPDEDEAVSLRRELLLALGDVWVSTRDLATAVGVSRFQSLDPVRTTLSSLRDEGLAAIDRRPGSRGYLWRAAQPDPPGEVLGREGATGHYFKLAKKCPFCEEVHPNVLTVDEAYAIVAASFAEDHNSAVRETAIERLGDWVDSETGASANG